MVLLLVNKRRRLNTVKLYNHVELVIVVVMKENLLESVVKCKVSVYKSIIRLFE